MIPENQKEYIYILDSLKQKIRQARQTASIAVNVQMLTMYWEIGKTIAEKQQAENWGAKVVDKLAADLKIEFPDMTGFSPRNLRYMREFAVTYPQFPFLQTPSAKLQGNIFGGILPLVLGLETEPNAILQGPTAKLQSAENQTDIILQTPSAKLENPIIQTPLLQLTWSHHIILLTKVKDQNERSFYIKKAIEHGWSVAVLNLQIQSKLYQRQGNTIDNFAATMPAYDSDLARETFKSPYLFDFLTLAEDAKERDIERGLIHHLKKFMLELGRGFAYVGNQYNLKVEDDEFFLDLLFYNVHMHHYIVFELKVGDFKPEYSGKLNFYINTVDGEIKGPSDNPTIGILLCKTPNKTEVKYALQGISSPLGIADYEFTTALSKQLAAEMPTIEELEAEIEREYEELKSPTQKRLDALKEKLAAFQKEEVKETATIETVTAIKEKSILPLLKELIAAMEPFKEMFYSHNFRIGRNEYESTNIEEWEKQWNAENVVRTLPDTSFFCNFSGFKKAGTDSFSASMQITVAMATYNYSVGFSNQGTYKPITKKLYHENFTKAEISTIVELATNHIIDSIEANLSRIPPTT